MGSGGRGPTEGRRQRCCLCSPFQLQGDLCRESGRAAIVAAALYEHEAGRPGSIHPRRGTPGEREALSFGHLAGSGRQPDGARSSRSAECHGEAASIPGLSFSAREVVFCCPRSWPTPDHLVVPERCLEGRGWRGGSPPAVLASGLASPRSTCCPALVRLRRAVAPCRRHGESLKVTVSKLGCY